MLAAGLILLEREFLRSLHLPSPPELLFPRSLRPTILPEARSQPLLTARPTEQEEIQGEWLQRVLARRATTQQDEDRAQSEPEKERAR